jgi:hypothetical protein
MRLLVCFNARVGARFFSPVVVPDTPVLTAGAEHAGFNARVGARFFSPFVYMALVSDNLSEPVSMPEWALGSFLRACVVE